MRRVACKRDCLHLALACRWSSSGAPENSSRRSWLSFRRASLSPQPLDLGGDSGAQPQLAVRQQQQEQAKPVITEEHRALADIVPLTPRQVSVGEGNMTVPSDSPARQLLTEARRQFTVKQLEKNQALEYPTHPDELVPEFRRFRRHSKLVLVVDDPNDPRFPRRDHHPELPPVHRHPLNPDAVIGAHITHGDGNLGIVGTGEIGFDARPADDPLPKSWRGLNPNTVVGQRLPTKNGTTIQDATVKLSFGLSGRGVFATRAIEPGELIMVVASTAQAVGLNSLEDRLVDTCVEILLNAHRGTAEDRDFLHNWILTGQMSALVEKWPERLTKRVLAGIGGDDVLAALELHTVHIARLAAVIDMNHFLVESAHHERRGLGYWPEAGLLNHSCLPNATYDIMPEHVYRESEYFPKASCCEEEGEDHDSVIEQQQQQQQHEAVSSSSPPSDNSGRSNEVSEVAQGESSDSALVATNTTTHDPAEFQPGAVDLTGEGAPTYLFCCRAVKRIAPGEEVLISYIPPQWSFDARQHVLRDRYRFWCKCQRCAPTLDRKYAVVPKFVILLVFAFLTLQGLAVFVKHQVYLVDDDDDVCQGAERPFTQQLLPMRLIRAMRGHMKQQQEAGDTQMRGNADVAYVGSAGRMAE